MRPDRIKSLGVALAVVVATHLALTLAPAPARAQEIEPLAMSYLPGNAIAWDLDVAMDKGFFKAEGFDGRPVVFQNAPQSAQMLITGEVQLGTGQLDPFLLAFRSGARDIAVIAAPADRPDWFINVRPEIKSIADLKGKFVATAALQVGETWLAAKWLGEQGLKPQDFSFLVVGTSALKFAALQRGSVAAAIMFQPLAMEAQLTGYSTIYRFLDGKPLPPVLYVVNRQWAAQKDRGKRLSRAIVQSHKWLLDPGNRNEAIAILQKYTKREAAVTNAVYDLFLGKDKLYTADAAVDIAGVETEIATMIEKGVLPPGTALMPRDYMLPRELGGLYR
ncbi:MAG TPA: ABC transporter substrate-binding protein [Xanthobacteraceae bacterium]|jgi:ABC-type nitrate/sulfonate/bicarbonate transport system substrate-binding protein